MRTLFILALLLCGCTTQLQTSPVTAGFNPQAGIGYHLPALVHTITVTRTLVGCDGDKPTFLVAATAEPSYLPGELHSIDPSKLAGFMKTSGLGVERYPNGTLKSVNASATDHGPEMLAKAVEIGVAVAGLASGLPIPAIASAAPADSEIGGGSPSPCPIKLLADAEAKAQAVATIARELAGLEGEMEPLRTAALLGALSEADKENFVALRRRINDATGRLEAARAQSAALEARLSIAERREFTPSPDGADLAMPFPSDKPVARAQQEAWLTGLFGGSPQGGVPEAAVVAMVRAEPGAASAQQPVGDPVGGVLYRSPAQTTLTLCRTAKVAECESGQVEPLMVGRHAAPQFGRTLYLPFKNGFGQSNALEARFDEAGQLLYARYDDKEAVGLRAADATERGLATMASFAAARRAARMGELDAEIARAEKERKLIDAKTALSGRSIRTARLTADLEARETLLKLRKSVGDLEAELEAQRDVTGDETEKDDE